MNARTLEVADALATALARFLKSRIDGVTVTREYAPKIDDELFAAWIAAQKALGVFVVPVRKKIQLETRASDKLSFSFAVVFAERCQDGGVPSNAWMDQRVATVDACDVEFGDLRKPFEVDGCTLRAVESEIPLIFDPDAYRLNHAFWSVWTITLQESVRMT